MKLSSWARYYFKDNRRFWVCAKFYFNFMVVWLLGTSVGKFALARLPKGVCKSIIGYQLNILNETIKFKLERNDRG